MTPNSTHLSPSGSRLALLGAITVVVGGLVTWAVYVALAEPPSPPVEPYAYFYDLNADSVYRLPVRMTPPTQAPSGPDPVTGDRAGVGAHVYACRSCDEDPRLGYVYQYTDAARAAIDAAHHVGPEAVAAAIAENSFDLMVRRREEKYWYPLESPEGRALLEQIAQACGPDEEPIECLPPSDVWPPQDYPSYSPYALQ